jgi:FemAB-related protein (PEP-CTERM system-associated)
MEVIQFGDDRALYWDRFVNEHNDGYFMLYGWKRVLEETYGYSTFFLAALEGGNLTGVLPLFSVKSLIAGKRLMSLPGGGLFTSRPSLEALLHRAIELTAQHALDYLVLKESRIVLGEAMEKQGDRFTFVFPLPNDAEVLWSNMGQKVRTLIRKARKCGLEVTEGSNFLNEFYCIYARNMRDLGTPVYSRRFFENIVNTFPERVHFILVSLDGNPIGAILLFGHRRTLYALGASSLRRHFDKAPNMLLFWEVLRYASTRYAQFDFGSSVLGSGTLHFKQQWRANRLPVFDYYYPPRGSRITDWRSVGIKPTIMRSIWRMLPLSLANSLGPAIRRHIPFA